MFCLEPVSFRIISQLVFVCLQQHINRIFCRINDIWYHSCPCFIHAPPHRTQLALLNFLSVSQIPLFIPSLFAMFFKGKFMRDIINWLFECRLIFSCFHLSFRGFCRRKKLVFHRSVLLYKIINKIYIYT